MGRKGSQSWTPEEEERLKAAYDTGMGYKFIARLFPDRNNRSVDMHIHTMLARGDLIHKKPRPFYTKDNPRRSFSIYMRKSQHEIMRAEAYRLGIPLATLAAQYVREGVERCLTQQQVKQAEGQDENE